MIKLFDALEIHFLFCSIKKEASYLIIKINKNNFNTDFKNVNVVLTSVQ